MPYFTAENLDNVTKSLEKDLIKLFQWCSDNQMTMNHDKCYWVTTKVIGFEIKNTEREKMLGIKVDCELKFENYLDGVIKKASNKVNALSRITSFISLAKNISDVCVSGGKKC